MGKVEVEYKKSPAVRISVVVAAGALALGGMVGLSKQSNEGTTEHYNKAEVAAIQEVKTATNAVLAVRSGAKYRTSPTMCAGESEGLPTTVAGEVPDGKVLILDRPLEYVDDEGNTWAGFELASKPTDGGTADASKLAWINVSQLNSPQSGGERYVERFEYNTKSTPIDLPKLSVSINEFGTFQSSEMKTGYPIAVGQIISDEAFTQRVQAEQLSLAG